MTPELKRSFIQHGVAIDLVILATGFALLFPPRPALFAAVLFAVVAASAWMGGWPAGITATCASALLLAAQFGFGLSLLAVAVAGVLISLLVSEIATDSPSPRKSDPHPPSPRESGERVAEGRVTGTLLPLLTTLALPLLAVIIYTNLSDLLVRNFSIPSILQPLVLMLAAAIWWYRKALNPAAVVLQPLALVLAAYCALLFASSIWAADTAPADAKTADAVKNFCIFAVVACLLVTWRHLRATVIAVVTSATLLATLTIAQAALHTRNEFRGLARLESGHIAGDRFAARPAGPIGDPNFYGEILLFTVPLALFLSAGDGRWTRRVTWLGAAAIITAGVSLTYSRGAIVALGVVALLVLVTMRVRPMHAAAAALVAVLFVALTPGLKERFLSVEELLGAGEPIVKLESSLEQRKLFLTAAWEMFDDHPLFGIGAGNFTRYFTGYANEIGTAAPLYDPPGTTRYPHSLYLEIGAETGLFGLACFLSAMALAAGSMIRARRILLLRGDRLNAALVAGVAIALAAYLVSSLFLHGSYARYLWFLLAPAAGIARLIGEPAATPKRGATA